MDDVVCLIHPLRESVLGLTVHQRGAFPFVVVSTLAPFSADGIKGGEGSGEGFVVEGLVGEEAEENIAVVGGGEDFLAFLAQFRAVLGSVGPGQGQRGGVLLGSCGG